MLIRNDDLTGAEIAALLTEHLAFMRAHSPPCSVHALDLERLRQPDITFWSAWEGSALLGCVALKELDARHGELKSMRTASPHLRKGVASSLLRHVIATAKERSYARLSLETGSTEPFYPALALYQRFGFTACGPFADYREDPFSRFFTLEV
jgi:putative acetyltransferase